jgi:exodeoxyribonuclease V alpha subunit
VVRKWQDGTVDVAFGEAGGESEEVHYTSDVMTQLSLAYALTFHRCQGSEFPCAIVVIHKAAQFMLHRSLMYTGLTRAQKSVFLVGDPTGIARCLEKVTVESRRTLLSLL